MEKNKLENKLISIIVPVLNEEQNIPVLYNKIKDNLKGYYYEIIFINDGSSDQSKDVIENMMKKNENVKLINLSRNFGHQIAISCGIDYCMGDAAIIIDADLQDPPEVIPKMIQKWQEGFDVVYAVRKAREGESILKKLTASIFYRLMKILSGTKIPLDTGDFRLISKKVILVLKRTREYQRFMRGLISWVGFSQVGIEFTRDKRFSGKTKYPLFSMIKFALDGILSFSLMPLRIVSIMGIVTVAILLLLIIYSLYRTIIGQTVPGWASTTVIILFLGSIQLISVGIIGEYLGRVYEEVKRRPLYIIDSVIGFKTSRKNNKTEEFEKWD
ncbi:glycosyltransferase [Candidatus Curtissbacteria bacterium RIFCSPLOWO2_01_FULL_37_9]|uniref:Glycosyltransferase n=1 Tax=Candidatus Curtissbacteria bacterium RIFCSPLOWO2_01_FULL_37_9 TaxID=1797724 RepID=A0A1F5GR18_9BACT|nr:MAG: glycosyltransferase [Candidatus Curtissbacteria bacterium RIFCSPLOWO2_01_FULL_37_9]